MKPYGIFCAIILTYVTSSLLHGINIQTWAVLLSLGFATYAEYTIRKKIADIFDACVLANTCEDCTHRHNHRNPFVIVINFGFRILAMVHLAYLGHLMDGPLDSNDGFTEKPHIASSLRIIQTRWGGLDYISHWIILLTIGIGAII